MVFRGYTYYSSAEKQIAERVRLERARLGLPPDPGSDDVWVQRIMSGEASLAEATSRLEQKWASGDFTTPEGAPAEEERTLDYESFAPPWMSGPLLQEFVDQWAQTGDANLAMAAVRRSSHYDQYFVGNRREDGSLRYSENEYLSVRDAFHETAGEFGLGQLDKAKIEGLFRQDVSAQEFYRGVETAYSTFTEPGGDTPSGLMNAYVDSLVGTGSSVAALEAARSAPEYDSIFAGNRREDGSLRMGEQDYFAYKRGWQRTLVSYGLNPSLFEGAGRFVQAIENELSIEEVAGRLGAASDQIVGNIEQVREFYSQYGVEMTDEAILGSFIDPTIGRDVLERRISASQVGGEAALQGFRRSLERAEEMARAGLTQQQARGLYAEAADRVPTLDVLAGRYNDARGAFGVEGYEDAQVLGDAGVRRRMERRLQDEASAFTGRSDTRRDQSGALVGLRQR